MNDHATAPSYSTRLLRKGALVEETYRILAQWNDGESLSENLQRIRATNAIGARNERWLREVTSTLSSRFSRGDSLAALAHLARSHYPFERWKFCLLWHFGSTDGLFLRFMSDFLLRQHADGVAALDTNAVAPFVAQVEREHWLDSTISSYGRVRMARDLLLMGTDFGLLSGKIVRRFTHAAIPDDAFLYALYSLQAEFPSISRAIDSPRWSVFLLTSAAVEHEMFNLHQLRRIRYEQAGSIRELGLPYENLLDYARSLVS